VDHMPLVGTCCVAKCCKLSSFNFRIVSLEYMSIQKALRDVSVQDARQSGPAAETDDIICLSYTSRRLLASLLRR
jgi:hypothetical protein